MRRRLAVLLMATIAALGGAEAVLWYAFPQDTISRLEMNNPAMYAASRSMPYALRPGFKGQLVRREFATAIELNELGLRDDPVAPTPDARPRILVVGDSFTFGWGVEAAETYASVLEQNLSERRDGGVEVVNAGFAACYYPDTYYLYLKEHGRALAPDLVLVGLFVGNDLDHSLALENRWTAVDDDGLPTAITNVDSKVDRAGYWVRRRRPRRYEVPVLRESHVFQLLAKSAARIVDRLRIPAPIPRSGDPRQPAAATASVPYNYRQTYEPRTEAIFEKVVRLLREMHELAATDGVPLLVVLIPERSQLGQPRQTDAADYDKPQRLLGERLGAAGIPYLDLLPAVLAEPDPEALYLPMDSHWNPRGHRLGGERIADWLVTEGRLPTPRRSVGVRVD